MKIALVLVKPPTYSETFLVSKIEGLQKNGVEVILVTNTTKSSYPGVIHKQNPSKMNNAFQQAFSYLKEGASLLFHLPKVLRYIQLERKEGTPTSTLLKKIYLNATLLKLRVDWVHFGFATLAIDRELVAKAIGAKMGVSFRGFDINVYPLKHPNCYDVLWRNVDKVHSISAFLLAQAQKLGLPKETLAQIITPAITFKDLPKPLTYIPFVKPLTIVTVARFNWVKGIDIALKAMALLKTKEIDFKYKIIGDGSREIMERIKFLVYELNLSNEVDFLGKKTHGDSLELINNAAIYLQTSWVEGFCNALLEAQALGKISIAGHVGALAENIVPNTTGFLVSKHTPEAFANKIQSVIELPFEQLQTLSKNAMERVSSSFSIDSQQEKFVNFFTEPS